MRKSFLIISIVLASLVLAVPSITLAQGQDSEALPSVDDEVIEQKLREKGLDKAPEPIVPEEVEWKGEQPSSGFVDDDGKALSDEEYAAYLANEKENKSKRQSIVISAFVVILIAGGVGAYFAATSRRKKA